MNNPFKSVLSFLSRLKNNWRESQRQENMKAVSNSFYLNEKNGKVYILHNGIAVKEFHSTESIETITGALSNIRLVALEHEFNYHILKTKQ